MSFEDWISIIGALVAGLALGWLLHDWIRGRQARPAPQAARSTAPPSSSNGSPQRARTVRDLRKQVLKVEKALADRQQEMVQNQTELVKVNAELTSRDRELENLRNRLEKRDKEHSRLLQELGERRARMTEAGADLYRLNQELIRREEDLNLSMSAVSERSHELEVLEELDAGFQADIDELIGEMQEVDGELARMRSVLAAKEDELNDAQALLAQREAALDEIIRSRERMEYEIRSAYEQMELIGTEHQRLMARLAEAAAEADASARLLSQTLPVEPEVPQLDSGEPDEPDIRMPVEVLPPPEDDLTRIKGIGPGYASLLRAADITTYEQLSELPAEQLREMLTVPRFANVEAWIAEARALAAERELGMLKGEVQDADIIIDDFPEDDEDDELPDDWLDELLQEDDSHDD